MLKIAQKWFLDHVIFIFFFQTRVGGVGGFSEVWKIPNFFFIIFCTLP